MIGTVIAFITSFLSSKLGPPMFIVIGAIGAAGWIAFYFQYNAFNDLQIESATKLEAQKGETRKAVDANESLVTANNLLTQQRAEDAVNLAASNRQSALSLKERDEANDKYDAMRSKMAGAMSGRGSHVARLANRATKLLLDGLETATCRAGCDESGNPNTEAPIGEPAAIPEPS